jgi:tetratricopeptide (TPR) repeat protein
VATHCPKCQFDNTSDSKFCKECGTQLLPFGEPSVTKTIETPAEEYPRGSTFADRYKIIEKLGTGGMGAVYRVEDTNIGQDIALKLIKPDIASDKKTIERFRNELKTTRMISHRNVCRMFDLAETEGTYYITMEYVPGEDLKSLIRRVRRLDSATAITIAKQVCEGLSEAHRLGVVHRDLKSNNIMIDKEGNARIMDFGIARSLKAKGLTGEGIIIGTPEYMSPEQAEAKEVDNRSDIYSLGVILYEMVTGQLPFEGDTPLSIAMKHKGEKPKDPKELNPQMREDLNVLILKCLEKDKDKRYQSAEELYAGLNNIEKGIPITDREIPEKKSLTSKEITVTFGLKKLLIPALVFIAVVIAGVVIWKILPEKEASGAPQIENSIAVISFENQTGDAELDHLKYAIPNLLITNLENTELFNDVLTWERMRDICKQIGKEDVDFIDSDLGFEICRREGIEALITGFYTKGGDLFTTSLTVYDVRTKKSRKSTKSSGLGEQSFFASQIDELSKEIAQSMDIQEARLETAQYKIADVATNSIEAYKYFLQGRENARHLNLVEARSFLEKAVELDQNFAMAYHWLGYVCIWLEDTAAKNEAYSKAKALSHMVTEKERLLIDARYARSIEGDREKEFQILIQLTNKYPKEKQGHFELGSHYQYTLHNLDNAVDAYKKAVDLDPNYGHAINELGLTYARLRDFEKALEYLKKYAYLFPKDANPLDSLAVCYFLMGRLDDAMTKCKETLEINPDFWFPYKGILYFHALMENYPEAMRAADKFIETASTPARKRNGIDWRGFLNYFFGKMDQALSDFRMASNFRFMGLVYCERKEFELSRKHLKSWFDSAVKSYPPLLPRYTAYYNLYLGLVDMKEGLLNSAKSRLAKIKSISFERIPYERDWIMFYHDMLYGEILLAENEIEEAIAFCENASPLGQPYYMFFLGAYNLPFIKDVLARAYLKNGEIDKAIAEYERLITFDPDTEDRSLIHPKYHYRLAKLYEQKDWVGKAIEHYEKFLTLWKDADPGIAEVEDAKERVAELRTP